jgi:hypothetical protein
MQFIGYNWELTDSTMIPDAEIDTVKLNWRSGDYWQIKEVQGKMMLVKVDPIIQFLLEGSLHG